MNVYEESRKYFPTPFQELVFYDRYSRYNYDLGRRETWVETVNRAVDYLHELGGCCFSADTYDEIRLAILNQQVMPSMRLMAMAGPAARRQNVSLYNCGFCVIDDPIVFSEAMLISLAGCGFGYSVERKFVDKLPNLPDSIVNTQKVHTIEDTSEGWQDAIKYIFTSLYEGHIPKFNYSELRPAGTPLKIKGGVASGPKPLKESIDFIITRFLDNYCLDDGDFSRYSDAEKLSPIQAHDMVCAIGNCSVSGGVRRSSLAAIFDKDDKEMLLAKQGNYNNYRWNANNSVAFTDPLEQGELLDVMSKMYDGKNGEPGLYSVHNAGTTSPIRRSKDYLLYPNPCFEIYLRENGQLCNLSAVIARPEDTVESLSSKVSIATLIGTIQSTATHFPGLRDQWKKNCEEERLLGVDITGQMDCPILDKGSVEVRNTLRNVAISVNKIAADALSINQSAAITTCKPSGNTSSLVDCAAGIHPRYAPYYIRRIRINIASPIFKVLYESGLDFVPENGQDFGNMTTAVFSFPVKSPEGAIHRNEITAIEHLDYWLENKEHWSEHNVSVTIQYENDEKLPIINWLWKHKDVIGGIAFLPKNGAKYELPPYEEIDKETYESLVDKLPVIKWELLEKYETTDHTNATKELACGAGASCDI
jgi:ribonucleoside-triphosphate reductase (thioredoxin)